MSSMPPWEPPGYFEVPHVMETDNERENVVAAYYAGRAITDQMIDRAARKLYELKSGLAFDKELHVGVHVFEARQILEAALDKTP